MKRVLLAGAALFTLTACQNMDALAPWIEQGNQAAKAAGYDTDSRLAGAIKEYCTRRLADNYVVHAVDAAPPLVPRPGG